MVEAITAEPPRPVRRAVFEQHWRDLTFLHWPVPPPAVAPLLPPGTEPDVLGGVTWVGLVPFVMSRVRILGTPAVPHLSGFPETNVRLYAVDGEGRRGVVFASLEAGRLLPVLTARGSYHLPYMWARMRVRREGDRMRYTTRRRWPAPRGLSSTVDVRIGQSVEAGELEHFLTARWGLFSAWYGGRSVWAPVEHVTWPLHAATVLDLDDELVAAAGLEVSGAPHALWSPGVQVRIGRPELLRAPVRGRVRATRQLRAARQEGPAAPSSA